MTQLFPERTIQYKTFAKQTLVDGLKSVFKQHPDALLQNTKISIEYPKTEADYPSIVIRMYERQVYNAGVGHEESVIFQGETDSIEVTASLPAGGGAQLRWPPIKNAVGYNVYRGTAPGEENQLFQVTDPVFYDTGLQGSPATPPDPATVELPTPSPNVIVTPTGELTPGLYYYRVTALAPSEAIRFKHYFYDADIEFAIYALSAYDRDLVADTLVQTIAMGRLDDYTDNFFERIYPTNDLYPYSQFHFINVNSDQIQGYGETQTKTPWGSEDDLLYGTSYRVGVFGELYSLPPDISFAVVRKITVYPSILGWEAPQGDPKSTSRWISNDQPF